MKDNKNIYPVYILSRVAEEIYQLCKDAVPHETMGKLLGYRCMWQGKKYVKIVDWAMGSINSSHTHAQFTAKGTREYELFVDERYGKNSTRPLEVGIVHSHPFNSDPHFSQVDYDTFLSFPYDKVGNVFVLIDPLSSYFKVYQIVGNKSKNLEQISWIKYFPQV